MAYGVQRFGSKQFNSYAHGSLRFGETFDDWIRRAFANNEQGFVLGNINKFEGLFQDAAVTTPVTAFEQPVGLCLDISGRGNHAYQSTNPNRPIVSARYNLLLSTDTLATQSVTTQATTYILAFSGTGSVTLSGTATGVKGSGSNSVNCTAGTLTLTVTGSVRFASLLPANDGTGLPLYQAVDTSSVYDVSGFPAYLKFNGVNQCLQTNSIDFTGTDKVTVWAGMRKMSDAARMIIVELSSTIATNNGTFAMFGGSGVDGTIVYASKGTVNTNGAGTSIYQAPCTNILTGIGNISGDISRLRTNAVEVAENLSDQGTGNYGNYVLNIGSRAGTSLFFNGRLYSLIMRGAESDANLLNSLERYTNKLTKAGTYNYDTVYGVAWNETADSYLTL
jgi:hypothetical protein